MPSLTAEEIRESVAAMKWKKAPGLDDMPKKQKMEMVLRFPEHRLVRQVLLNCAKPTHETLFGDVPNLSIENATKNV